MHMWTGAFGKFGCFARETWTFITNSLSNCHLPPSPPSRQFMLTWTPFPSVCGTIVTIMASTFQSPTGSISLRCLSAHHNPNPPAPWVNAQDFLSCGHCHAYPSLSWSAVPPPLLSPNQRAVSLKAGVATTQRPPQDPFSAVSVHLCGRSKTCIKQAGRRRLLLASGSRSYKLISLGITMF